MEPKHDPCILGLFAHPDDAGFLCAGTLTLLQQTGVRSYARLQESFLAD